jgi:DNA-binding NtrC family response regulator
MSECHKQKTILLVDDDETILNLLSKILEGEYNILTAPDGAAALEKSRDFESGIDLLLSDFQMPGLSGIQLATAITIDRPKLKVLLMSGFPEGMLVLNDGWHFLPKPFIPSQLRALIVGLLHPDARSKFVTD